MPWCNPVVPIELKNSTHNQSLRWLPPPLGYIKINVDGAVGSQCAAAVMRDHNGKFRRCNHNAYTFSMCWNSRSSRPHSRIPYGARNVNCPVLIEGDAKVLITMINNEHVDKLWRSRTIIRECIHLQEANANWQIHYIHPQGDKQSCSHPSQSCTGQ